ncbi:hypothetical protein FQR65_LT15824 [Abscondita terminalis]|nr:hypothetical protein FQR65_LT15824 [Abscondita terminalis]
MSFEEENLENQVRTFVEEMLLESDEEVYGLMEISLEMSSLSSSSDSNDSSFCEPVSAVKIKCFIEIVDLYSEAEFKSHFRICRQIGEHLIRK